MEVGIAERTASTVAATVSVAITVAITVSISVVIAISVTTITIVTITIFVTACVRIFWFLSFRFLSSNWWCSRYWWSIRSSCICRRLSCFLFLSPSTETFFVIVIALINSLSNNNSCQDQSKKFHFLLFQVFIFFLYPM